MGEGVADDFMPWISLHEDSWMHTVYFHCLSCDVVMTEGCAMGTGSPYRCAACDSLDLRCVNPGLRGV